MRMWVSSIAAGLSLGTGSAASAATRIFDFGVWDAPEAGPGAVAGARIAAGMNLLSGVPEPMTWALFLVGLGLIGFALRL